MNDKMFVYDYYDNVIPLCKATKAHATNMLLLENNLVVLESLISGVASYLVANDDIDYNRFLYTFFNIPEISKTNTKFKKTKSVVDWRYSESNMTNFLLVENPNMEPVKSPIIDNLEGRINLIDTIYRRVPNWNVVDYQNILRDESSNEYTKLPRSFIDDMVDKKLCDIKINGYTILLSRPFLGDCKKTEYIGYRVINQTNDKIYLKFKQTEPIGNIYTYAAFLLID